MTKRAAKKSQISIRSVIVSSNTDSIIWNYFQIIIIPNKILQDNEILRFGYKIMQVSNYANIVKNLRCPCKSDIQV